MSITNFLKLDADRSYAAGHRILAMQSYENIYGTKMPGNPREMITSAERRFPVRIRIAVPPNGPGQRYSQNNRLA